MRSSHRPDNAAPYADPAPPSKSELKRQMLGLQELGEELINLPDGRLAAVDIPDRLREAIAEFKRTRSHEGRRRQLQFIGKLMRGTDEAPLREAVAAFRLGSARETLQLHETERWRDELIADDDALTRWARQFPQSDLQRLRTLVRSAQRDAALEPGQRSGRGYRELFRFVKPWLGETPDGTGPTEDIDG
jgi:ribosome-associated protein